MCHHLRDEVWEADLEADHEEEPTAEEVTDEPERREAPVPAADD